ncbi:MAG: hypothetical protein IPP40_11450 [bacterium]|nr:hypothetical protein [bacterium]
MRFLATFTISVAAAMLIGNVSLAANVSILNGNVDLVVSTASAGSEPDPDIDQTAQLQWDNWPNSAPTKKITVQTNLASPQFALGVQAINITPSDGTSAGEVQVSTSATDFINSIPAKDSPDNATCDLRYKATALAADGTGIDTHTITYTIVDQ